jgi:hypothetical protein
MALRLVVRELYVHCVLFVCTLSSVDPGAAGPFRVVAMRGLRDRRRRFRFGRVHLSVRVAWLGRSCWDFRVGRHAASSVVRGGREQYLLLEAASCVTVARPELSFLSDATIAEQWVDILPFCLLI